MAVQKQDWPQDERGQSLHAGDLYQGFIPSQKGEPLSDQILPWGADGIRKDMQSPIPMHSGDPMTLSNVIRMMAVEMQHWHDYLHFAQWTSNADFKRLLISLAAAEQIHHLKLSSLIPSPHDPSEMVLASEMGLLNAYSEALASEPDDSIRNAFKMLFNDHLEHADYAAKRVVQLGCPIDTLTGGADLSEGKPLERQFIRPHDTIWEGRFDGSYSKDNVQAITLTNVDLACAGELTAWDVYQSALLGTSEQDIRSDFAAFQSIEHQHTAILDSIMDPCESQMERALVHEQTEITNYQRLMNEESNPQVQKVFADLYKEDLEHARLLGELIA